MRAFHEEVMQNATFVQLSNFINICALRGEGPRNFELDNGLYLSGLGSRATGFLALVIFSSTGYDIDLIYSTISIGRFRGLGSQHFKIPGRRVPGWLCGSYASLEHYTITPPPAPPNLRP